jgi:hypothetical protein
LGLKHSEQFLQKNDKFLLQVGDVGADLGRANRRGVWQAGCRGGRGRSCGPTNFQGYLPARANHKTLTYGTNNTIGFINETVS